MGRREIVREGEEERERNVGAENGKGKVEQEKCCTQGSGSWEMAKCRAGGGVVVKKKKRRFFVAEVLSQFLSPISLRPNVGEPICEQCLGGSPAMGRGCGDGSVARARTVLRGCGRCREDVCRAFVWRRGSQQMQRREGCVLVRRGETLRKQLYQLRPPTILKSMDPPEIL